MISGRQSLPKRVIDAWPEVFNEVTFDKLPHVYLDELRITFKDGTTWDIEIPSTEDNPTFTECITQIIDNYEHRIKKVSFKVKTELLITDVKKYTTRLLRKLNL